MSKQDTEIKKTVTFTQPDLLEKKDTENTVVVGTQVAPKKESIMDACESLF